MKKYTQEEFNKIKRNENGILIYPTGDYSVIKSFGNYSRFGSGSRFGSDSNFGNYSRFGSGSNFGSCSNFGNYSNFGSDSRFGSYSNFGSDSSYNGIRLRDEKPLLILDGIYRYPIHVWFTKDNNVILQIGCIFFNNLSEAYKEMKERNEKDDTLQLIIELIISRELEE